MSTTQHNGHDTSVEEQLSQLPEGTTTAGYFARAIELGASAGLLSRLTLRYTQTDPHNPHRVTSLPYIRALLEAGWSINAVRDLVSTNCLTDHGYGEEHYQQEGFWNDDEAWQLFGTAEQLMSFLRPFAAQSPRVVLSPEGRAMLAEQLGLRHIERRLLLRYIRELEETAMLAHKYIDNEHQLDIAIRVATPKKPHEQLKMAAGHFANGWNLVFMGYVLAKHGSYSRDADRVHYAIHQQMESVPHTRAAVYRWLAEGYRRANNEHWQFRLSGSTLSEMFRSYDWHLLPVRKVRDHLQVTLPGNPRVIVRHDPDGETLAEGDEVLVHRDQLKSLTPVSIPGGKIYTRRLTPAAPATPEMLAKSSSYFYRGPFKERWKYA